MYYLALLFGLIWFLVCCVVMLVVSAIRFRNPSNGYLFTRLFNPVMAFVTGVHVEVRNRHRLYESQPGVFVGNHQSNVDIMIQSNCYIPRTVVIGKKEVLWIPLFGILFWLTGNLLIDRSDHEKAMKSMEAAGHFMKKKKGSIIIFAEGHRNRGSEQLLPFKKGAFHLAVNAQVPIVPFVAAPLKAFIDEKGHKIHRGTLPIEVMEPISTEGLTKDDVDALVERVYALMQAEFDKLKKEISQRSRS